MSNMRKSLKNALKNNAYPGRGIVVGKSSDGKKAMFAYFIMGRSVNSRNRVFKEYGDEVRTEPYDTAKVVDPSLIIYAAIKTVGKQTIVTNGDQTDTIEESLLGGKCFRHALMTREFEPDAPNFTPRISALLSFGDKATDGKYTYEMSILKSADKTGKRCNRYFFSYAPVSGLGHFIHTYMKDGNPLPSFEGEPEKVIIPNDLDAFAAEIWDNLNADNKISLYCREIDIKTGATRSVLINKLGE